VPPQPVTTTPFGVELSAQRVHPFDDDLDGPAPVIALQDGSRTTHQATGDTVVEIPAECRPVGDADKGVRFPRLRGHREHAEPTALGREPVGEVATGVGRVGSRPPRVVARRQAVDREVLSVDRYRAAHTPSVLVVGAPPFLCSGRKLRINRFSVRVQPHGLLRLHERIPLKLEFAAVVLIAESERAQRFVASNRQTVDQMEIEHVRVRRECERLSPVVVQAIPRVLTRPIPERHSADRIVHVGPVIKIDPPVDVALGNVETEPCALVPVGVGVLGVEVAVGRLNHWHSSEDARRGFKRDTRTVRSSCMLCQ
jgi:hypothetical protein